MELQERPKLLSLKAIQDRLHCALSGGPSLQRETTPQLADHSLGWEAFVQPSKAMELAGYVLLLPYDR